MKEKKAVNLIAIYWGSFCLCCIHALDADHVCTVSTLLFKKRPARNLFQYAFRWSLGHSLTLLTLASMMFFMSSGAGTIHQTHPETMVGLAMIGLGVWILLFRENKSSLLKDAPPTRFLFGMGILHGAAGSAAFLLMIPIGLAESFLTVVGYVFFFSFGIIFTMSLYSIALKKFLWMEFVSNHFVKLRTLAAILTIVIGIRLLGE